MRRYFRDYPPDRIDSVRPLALATCERAKTVETAGDGRNETPFAANICRDGPEKRRRCLIGSIGTTKTLNGSIRAPSRFEQKMDPALLVFRIQIGMIAAPRSSSIGKHEDALVAVHECLSFKDI